MPLYATEPSAPSWQHGAQSEQRHWIDRFEVIPHVVRCGGNWLHSAEPEICSWATHCSASILSPRRQRTPLESQATRLRAQPGTKAIAQGPLCDGKCANAPSSNLTGSGRWRSRFSRTSCRCGRDRLDRRATPREDLSCARQRLQCCRHISSMRIAEQERSAIESHRIGWTPVLFLALSQTPGRWLNALCPFFQRSP